MGPRYQQIPDNPIESARHDSFHTFTDEDTEASEFPREVKIKETALSGYFDHLFWSFCDVIKHIGLVLLPSPISKQYGIAPQKTCPMGRTEYLNGLRGVASFVVFAEHFLMRFHPNLFEEYGNSPRFFQLPGIRLLYSGHVMVAIFFVISGFSLSVQPLRAIYNRDWERLHHVLASATLRRAIRLVLPPAAVTFLVMIGVRFDLYKDHYEGTPAMVLLGPIHRPTFWLQFVDWIEYVLGRLIYPDSWFSALPNVTTSDYAAPLYTIPEELWSSLILFITLIGLSMVRPGVRLTTSSFLILLFAWCTRREISCFLAGMIIAELHLRHHDASRPRTARPTLKLVGRSVCWCVVFGTGVWLSSIPHTRGSYGSSSLGYHTISIFIPWNSNVYTIGSVLIVMAIDKLPFLQALFSMSLPQYLGKISFALYLVHWPILAAGGWDLVPVMWKLTGDKTEAQYEAGFWLTVLCMTPVVLWAADLCWRVIDLNSIRFAKHFEKLVLVT